MYKSSFQEKINNNALRCTLCSHTCVINENKTGICRARINQGGDLYSLVYGYPVATNIDPIEKKPLFHFLPGSLSYSLGTLGCNLACANCQNWDISQVKKLENQDQAYISPEKIVEDALSNDCQSIAFTYNEPTIFTEYALDIMKLAHENGIKNVWVSNGFMSKKCLEAILPYLDAINIDIKSFDEDFYRNNCGASLSPILENAKFLKSEQVHLEITTLIIPGLSDDAAMLNRLTEFIANDLDSDTPWHISKFTPQISWKLKKSLPTSDDIIYEAYQIGRDTGLNYIYVGNMPGDSKENTYCPKCGELAIARFGYQIERMDISGLCPNCEHTLDITE